MRKIICDRCDEDIRSEREVSYVTIKYGDGAATTGAGSETTYELCTRCATQTDRHITQMERQGVTHA